MGVTCQHILTAEHCVAEKGEEYFEAFSIGKPKENAVILYKTLKWDFENVVVKIGTVTWNAGFKYALNLDEIKRNATVDLAIIKLKKKLTIKEMDDRKIRPIALPEGTLTKKSTYWVIGFGRTPDPSDHKLRQNDELKL